MNLEIKYLHQNAKADRAHEADAGLDLYVTSINKTENYIEYGTGVAVSIPEGYFGLLCTRSSVSKKDIRMVNPPGIIDSGYHGELKILFDYKKINVQDFINLTLEDKTFEKEYKFGDKIAQLVVLPLVNYNIYVVNKFTKKTKRGEKGFGSTGA